MRVAIHGSFFLGYVIINPKDLDRVGEPHVVLNRMFFLDMTKPTGIAFL
jgi:hypothetical protein